MGVYDVLEVGKIRAIYLLQDISWAFWKVIEFDEIEMVLVVEVKDGVTGELRKR